MTIHLSDREARLLLDLSMTEADRIENDEESAYELDILVRIIDKLRPYPLAQNVPDNNDPDEPPF
jgi:hypothetical protein